MSASGKSEKWPKTKAPLRAATAIPQKEDREAKTKKTTDQRTEGTGKKTLNKSLPQMNSGTAMGMQKPTEKTLKKVSRSVALKLANVPEGRQTARPGNLMMNSKCWQVQCGLQANGLRPRQGQKVW